MDRMCEWTAVSGVGAWKDRRREEFGEDCARFGDKVVRYAHLK